MFERKRTVDRKGAPKPKPLASQPGVPAQVGLEGMSDEILLKILGDMGIRELGRLCCVSKRMHEIASFEDLWLPFFKATPWHDNHSLWEGLSDEVSTRTKMKCCSFSPLAWVDPDAPKGGRVSKLFGRRKDRTRLKKALVRDDQLTSVMDAIKPNSKFVIMLFGSGCVGTKTSLIYRFVRDEEYVYYVPTIEDTYTKTFDVDGITVVGDFLDTAGQEDFASRRPGWIAQCEGFLLGYAITSRASFDVARELYAEIVREKQCEASRIPIVLIGGMADLQAERQVPREEAQELAFKLRIPFFEVSALTNTNVTECIHQVIRECAARRATAAAPEARREMSLRSLNGSTYTGQCNGEPLQPDGFGDCEFSEADNVVFRSYRGRWDSGRPNGGGVLRLRGSDRTFMFCGW